MSFLSVTSVWYAAFSVEYISTCTHRILYLMHKFLLFMYCFHYANVVSWNCFTYYWTTNYWINISNNKYSIYFNLINYFLANIMDILFKEFLQLSFFFSWTLFKRATCLALNSKLTQVLTSFWPAENSEQPKNPSIPSDAGEDQNLWV